MPEFHHPTENKSTACERQRLAVGCLIEDKNSKFMTLWIVLWKVNTLSSFELISTVITEILLNVKVFATRRRESYSNTSGFLRNQPS